MSRSFVNAGILDGVVLATWNVRVETLRHPSLSGRVYKYGSFLYSYVSSFVWNCRQVHITSSVNNAAPLSRRLCRYALHDIIRILLISGSLGQYNIAIRLPACFTYFIRTNIEGLHDSFRLLDIWFHLWSSNIATSILSQKHAWSRLTPEKVTVAEAIRSTSWCTSCVIESIRCRLCRSS